MRLSSHGAQQEFAYSEHFLRQKADTIRKIIYAFGHSEAAKAQVMGSNYHNPVLMFYREASILAEAVGPLTTKILKVAPFYRAYFLHMADNRPGIFTTG